MAKGSAFEREVAKRLSRWWTKGQRDDVFWRSSNSGGRATVRFRKGSHTAGSYGDIAAIDPIGAPLLRFVTIELKRGYSKCSLADLLDPLDGERRDKGIGAFIKQAARSAREAGSVGWMLVQRRDKKKPIAVFPHRVLEVLQEECMLRVPPCPSLRMRVPACEEGEIVLYAVQLEAWLAAVSPEAVCAAVGTHYNRP